MVMAPGTGDRRGLERLGQSINLIVGQIVTKLPQTDAIIMIDFAKPIEASRDDRFVELLGGIDPWLRQHRR